MKQLFSVSLGVMTWETERIEAESAEEALAIARKMADDGEWSGQQTDSELIPHEDSVFNTETGHTEIHAQGDNRILDHFDKTREVAIVWCIDDVKEQRPHLTDEQAMEVLKKVVDNHDAELGVSWQTLEIYADEMFPDPCQCLSDDFFFTKWWETATS